MKILEAVIIDDEQPARDLLKVYLEDLDNVVWVGEAANGFEGVRLINEMKPDLVFLDIQMPKLDGFEMLEVLEHRPMVIFCTAFDEFAIKAFDEKAVDYLLKPFSRQRFGEAVTKAIDQADIKNEVALPDVADYKKPLDRIVIKDRKEIVLIDTDDIYFLEAQDDYVEIHSAKGNWLKQQTMKYFEEALDVTLFCRVHRRFIIKLDLLTKIDKMGKETYQAILKSGDVIPISLRGYNHLKKILDI